jgi:hypothetical protein
VETSGTSVTLVPNFFLGRPTGFLGLSLFFGFAVTIVLRMPTRKKNEMN